MSSTSRSACTQCRTERRAADVRMFPMCHKHRVCKECLAGFGARSQDAVSKDTCPVCDESRRRVGAQVRSRIWSDEHMKLECVACSHFGPGGALMRCGHAYCLPCLRRQPRSLQSRTVQGTMAKGCHDCEVAAAEERKDKARAAMERAEDAAWLRRDERETREFREDLHLQARPKKRAAPKRPAPAPLAASKQPAPAPLLPAGPSDRENIPSVDGTASALAKLDVNKAKRRVSFDPEVQQRLISPREPKQHKRRSWSAAASALAAGGSASTATSMFASSAASGLRLHTNPSWLHGTLTSSSAAAAVASEPRTPVEGRCSFRGWGIASP